MSRLGFLIKKHAEPGRELSLTSKPTPVQPQASANPASPVREELSIVDGSYSTVPPRPRGRSRLLTSQPAAAQPSTRAPAAPTAITMVAWQEKERSRQLFDAVVRGRTRLFRQLLAAGADPDCYRDEKGRSALHVAALKFRLYFLSDLLASGVDVGARDARGRTACDLLYQKRGFCTAIRHPVLSIFCPLWRIADYDCFTLLSRQTRAHLDRSPIPTFPDAHFGGVAVVHPGQEVALGRA